MGVCVAKIGHECGSSDGLQVFMSDDGDVNGYCFSCGTYVEDPYGDKPVPEFKPPDPEQTKAEVQAIAQYPVAALPDRKLKKSTLRTYGVRVEVSQQDGTTPTGVMFPYGLSGELLGWKVRALAEKKMWCIGSIKDAHLFGWAVALRTGARTLYITEGEYDALALYQILDDAQAGTQWADNKPAVVSLKSGASSAERDLRRFKKEILQHFEEVVLVFDMDAPGREAAEAVCRLNPTWKIASLPEKDANDCLINGASKACRNAVLFRSSEAKTSRVVVATSLAEAAREPAQMGISTPWQGLTDLTRGYRRGETWYWGAGVKMGKSELVNSIAADLIKTHQLPVFLAKPEESLNKSYKLLAGKIVGKIFHDPNIPFDEKAYDAAGDIIRDLALFTDVYQFLHWTNMKQDIVYVNQELGVHDIIIDPITCFTNQMSASEANEFLQGMAAEISALCKDLSMTAHLFCHLRAPSNGEPHERGGKVYSTQFAGSRGMMRSCNYMIGVEGNKDPDLDKYERNLRTLSILEDREFGSSGKVQLYWDDQTSLFREV